MWGRTKIPPMIELELETDRMYLGYRSNGNGGRRYLRYGGEKSLILIAPAGQGKFTDHIAWTVMTQTQSMFINDPKGESALVSARRRRLLGHTVYIINPFRVYADWPHVDMSTARFNPLAALSPDSPTFTSDIGVLGGALILHDGGQSHWADSARNLVNGV
jgi:type IV secretion system protein VirD4